MTELYGFDLDGRWWTTTDYKRIVFPKWWHIRTDDVKTPIAFIYGGFGYAHSGKSYIRIDDSFIHTSPHKEHPIDSMSATQYPGKLIEVNGEWQFFYLGDTDGLKDKFDSCLVLGVSVSNELKKDKDDRTKIYPFELLGDSYKFSGSKYEVTFICGLPARISTVLPPDTWGIIKDEQWVYWSGNDETV